MTTITIEIDREQDLSALKEVIDQMGLKYEVEEYDHLEYTDEFKAMLDKRYEEYLRDPSKVITAEQFKEENRRWLNEAKNR